MCSSSTLLLPFIGLNIPTYLISAIASCHRKRSNHLFSTNFLVQKLQSTKDTSHSLYLLLNYMYVFKKLGKYQNFFTRSLGRINTWFPWWFLREKDIKRFFYMISLNPWTNNFSTSILNFLQPLNKICNFTARGWLPIWIPAILYEKVRGNFRYNPVRKPSKQWSWNSETDLLIRWLQLN